MYEKGYVTIVLRGALCLPLFGTLSRTVTINTLYAPMRRYPVCFSLLFYYDATLPMLDWYGHHHSITTTTSCITPCLTLTIVLLTYDTLFSCSGYVSPLFTNTVRPLPYDVYKPMY